MSHSQQDFDLFRRWLDNMYQSVTIYNMRTSQVGTLERRHTGLLLLLVRSALGSFCSWFVLLLRLVRVNNLEATMSSVLKTQGDSMNKSVTQPLK